MRSFNESQKQSLELYYSLSSISSNLKYHMYYAASVGCSHDVNRVICETIKNDDMIDTSLEYLSDDDVIK